MTPEFIDCAVIINHMLNIDDRETGGPDHRNSNPLSGTGTTVSFLAQFPTSNRPPFECLPICEIENGWGKIILPRIENG